jgi:hypothetical protein
MSAKPLLDYFEPLRRYLQAYLRTHGVPVGWGRRQDPADNVATANAAAPAGSRSRIRPGYEQGGRKTGFRVGRRRNHRTPAEGGHAAMINSTGVKFAKGTGEVDFHSSNSPNLSSYTFSCQLLVVFLMAVINRRFSRLLL